MREFSTRRPGVRAPWFPLGFLVSMALVGCGGPSEYMLPGTELAPGADARIVADVDTDTALTRVGMDVQHLPPPERIEVRGKHFVVWQRPDVGTPWRRVGVLTYSAAERTGRLPEVTVPHTDFDLLVSVESQSNPRFPSSAVVIGPTSIE